LHLQGQSLHTHTAKTKIIDVVAKGEKEKVLRRASGVTEAGRMPQQKRAQTDFVR